MSFTEHFLKSNYADGDTCCAYQGLGLTLRIDPDPGDLGRATSDIEKDPTICLNRLVLRLPEEGGAAFKRQLRFFTSRDDINRQTCLMLYARQKLATIGSLTTSFGRNGADMDEGPLLHAFCTNTECIKRTLHGLFSKTATSAQAFAQTD
ncbi:hypothetical protein AA12467_2570 [Gluconobacter sphaericus NBRC 12467]|nr:hypothetical protein AA12467_2570 [Gluconobacter sphaericus NBRC 12467]